MLDRAGDHGVGVDLRRERQPEEEPPLGCRPAHEILQFAPEGVFHHIAFVLIVPAQDRELAIEQPAAARLEDDPLVQ